MTSSFTTNKVIEKPGNGDYVDTWNVPVNGDMDIIDQAFGGTTSLNATGGSATLTASQYRSLILGVSGAMGASVIYTIPSGVGGQWIVRNSTTDGSGGPWSVTIASGGGGASVSISRGTSTVVWSDGTNIRVVSAEPISAAFPSGTSMLFAQTAAPTGWTKSTTHNNKALRVVSGTASSGGSVDFTTAFASKSVTGTVGNTTLTIEQIPAHTHNYPSYSQSGFGGGGGTVAGFSNPNTPNTATSSIGGGQSHTHTFTGTAIDLAVAYVDVIICVKD